jgi:hypothetical protein
MSIEGAVAIGIILILVLGTTITLAYSRRRR